MANFGLECLGAPRLQESERLTGFCFEGLKFPLEPKTAFYDWLYCSFLWDHREWATGLYEYAGFTDIEFNPHRSINRQARSAALFLSLMKRDELESALQSPADFLQTLLRSQHPPVAVEWWEEWKRAERAIPTITRHPFKRLGELRLWSDAGSRFNLRDVLSRAAVVGAPFSLGGIRRCSNHSAS